MDIFLGMAWALFFLGHSRWSWLYSYKHLLYRPSAFIIIRKILFWSEATTLILLGWFLWSTKEREILFMAILISLGVKGYIRANTYERAIREEFESLKNHIETGSDLVKKLEIENISDTRILEMAKYGVDRDIKNGKR